MDNQSASTSVGASMIVEDETNPNGRSETTSNPGTHLSSGLKTSVHGNVYQLNLVMLFAWRGHRKGHHEFVLATEMEAADKFDDLVFKYKDPIDNAWTWRFLQAKHSLSTDKTININDLLSTVKDDFALGKYFVSFCKIKHLDLFRDGKPKDFIIVTNAGVADMNDLAKGWNEYFVQENDFKSDYILSFEDENSNNFDAWKLNSAMNDDTRKELTEIFGSSIRRAALATKTITGIHHIKTYLAITEMENALQLSKIILSNDDLDVQVRKAECLKWTKVVADVRKNMKFLNFNEIDNLNSSLTVAKSEKQFSNIKVGVNNLLTKCRDAITEYGIENSVDCRALENEKKFVADKVKFKELILKITQLTNENELESIVNETIDNLKDFVFKNTLAKLKNCTDFDFDGRKIELHKLLEKVIIDLTTVELALNNDTVEKVDEFFDKFRLITNYPNQKSLHELIKKEMNAADEFNLMDADLVNAFGVFEEDMLKFFTNIKHEMAEFYHGEKASELFKGISSKITNLINIGMTTWYVKKLPNFDMRSKETNLSELEEFLSANEPQVFHLITECTPLSTLKVNEMLANSGKYKHHDSYILIDLESMFNEKIQSHVLEAFKTPRTTNNREPYGLLVIECQSQNAKEDDEYDLVERLRDILRENKAKKLILIAKSSEKFTNPKRKFGKFQSKEDHTSFDDLTDESQNKLLEQKVNVQGSRVRLNELINRDSVVKNRVIDSNVMCRLLQNEPILIGSPNDFSSTGYVEALYIERVLQQRGENDDIVFNEEELLQCDKKIIVIADDAGVGKSTILTSLARKIKKFNSEMWVLRVNLLDYASTKNEINLGKIDFDHTDTERAIEFLADMILPNANDPINELHKNLLKLGLKKKTDENLELEKPKIVILFDAVDEISPTYKSKVIKMLKALAGSDAKKVMITTRVHVKLDLERELKQLSFNLIPLDDEAQATYLGNFLKWHLTSFRDSHGNVRSRTYKEILQTIDAIKNPEFSGKLLEIKQHYQSNDDDKLEKLIESIWKLDLRVNSFGLLHDWKHKIQYDDFPGNPLNLSMLIDVALDNDFEIANDLEFINIYDIFIESKFRIKFVEKNEVSRGKDDVETDMKTVKYILRNVHCELAVKILIEDWQSMGLPKLDKVEEYQRMLDDDVNVNEVIARNGLVILEEGHFKFVHRSFAEYFLNEYIIKNWADRQAQKLLFGTVIRHDVFHINLVFFNSSLKQKKLPPIQGTEALLIENLMEQIPTMPNIVRGDMFEVVKIVLNLIEIYLPDKNCPIKRSIIMACSGYDFGNNILHAALFSGDSQRLKFTFHWVEEHCGIGTIMNIFKRERVVNDVFYESALFAAVPYQSEFKMLLNIIAEYFGNTDFLNELILTNERVEGRNILYVLLQKWDPQATQYLLDWVKERCDTGTLMELVKRGRVNDGKIIETALHGALKNEIEVASKGNETVALILDFVKTNVNNDEFLKDFVLAKHIDLDRNVFYYSPEPPNGEGVLCLINWIIKHLNVEVLKELILTKRIGEIEIVKFLFEEIKKQDDASKIIAESMLSFINEHESEISF